MLEELKGVTKIPSNPGFVDKNWMTPTVLGYYTVRRGKRPTVQIEVSTGRGLAEGTRMYGVTVLLNGHMLRELSAGCCSPEEVEDYVKNRLQGHD